MTRRTRRLILYLTILFFILATPPVLLYAWGYGFDWSKQQFALTGGFYFESLPKKAEIFINGEVKETTPAFINNLLVKEYQIKIAKDGYHPWQKKLRLESKLVTEARNILLIPLKPEIEIIQEKLSKNFVLDDFLGLEKNNSLYYIEKTSKILYRNNPATNEKEQISLAPLADNQKFEIIISSNQQIAVLGKSTNPASQLYLLNPRTKIFELIENNVKGAQFSKDNKKLLYYTANELWVYYLEDILIQPNKKAGEKELITRLSQEIQQALWPSDSEHIIFTVGSSVKITELDGRDVRNTIDFISAYISQMAYSNQDEKLYFVKGDKLLTVLLK